MYGSVRVSIDTGPIDGLPCTVVIVTARVDTGFSTRVYIILGKS